MLHGSENQIGIDGAAVLSSFTRGGDFYIDTGACQEIISGSHFNIKSGSPVRCFVPHGFKLEDETEPGCDNVIFVTWCDY